MKLIIFSGLPGTGKSTLAEAVGKELGIPIFAKDRVEATLIQRELKPTNEQKIIRICWLRIVDDISRAPAYAWAVGHSR